MELCLPLRRAELTDLSDPTGHRYGPKYQCNSLNNAVQISETNFIILRYSLRYVLVYGGIMPVGKSPDPDSFTDGCDEGKEECQFEDGNHVE